MKRELGIYFGVIGVPAVLLALGGLRLLESEAERARDLGRDALQSRAELAAKDLRARVKSVEASILDRIDQLSELTPERLDEVTEGEPLVARIRMRQGPFGRVRRKSVRIDLDEIALLTRLPGWLRENGADCGSGGEYATAAEIRDSVGSLLMPSAHRRHGQVFATASLAPELPKWTVCVSWLHGEALAEQASRRVWLLGATVLALLVTTLLAGGWLLVRAARRARLEARLKTDFTANVSHEFKTPLTAIRLATEFAADHTEDPCVKTALGDVLEATARLSRMVADVLDYGRLEAGRTVVTEPMDVGNGVMAFANREALRHILDNLRDNAAKYAPGAPAETHVRVAGARVAIDVADRGPGVPESLRETIFERYRRGDDSATTTTGGCGLGLAIARRLARAMGGDLTYAPRDGGGSVFTLWLRSLSPDRPS